MASIAFPRFGKHALWVRGGPYDECNLNVYFGVKLAKEINRDCNVSIPTPDFSVPDKDLLLEGLRQTLQYVAEGGDKDLYVGCMAGRGRTGLFLAVMAKAWGIRKPIDYVRKHYNPHAVETSGQREFVNNLRIPFSIRWMAWKIKLGGLAR